MICNIFAFLWVALIIVLVVVLFKYAYNKPSAIYLFQNDDKTDIKYITLDVQGQQLNLLVDTGCGISIIRSDVAEALEHNKSPRKISLQALTPDSLASNVVSIPITVGNKSIIEDFALYGESDIANFEVLYGITLHGILGAEFFEKTNCKIDYKKHCLIIP